MEMKFAVIGDPISHSLSPQMHNSGFKAAFLSATYDKFRVKPGSLQEAVYGLKALGFSGWNVTLPHKENIIPFLDELTLEAKRAGAVNTVKVSEAKLIGHNTDGEGFLLSIQKEIGDLRGKRGVIIGAGGAAKGIALALMNKGMELVILNRTLQKADELAQIIQNYGGRASSSGLVNGEFLSETDLLVQTTSVGLHNELLPFSIQGLSKNALVVDIIFKPWETPFLSEARSKGYRTLNGLGMLLYQGTLAWDFWLGISAPVQEMWSTLLNEVKQSND